MRTVTQSTPCPLGGTTVPDRRTDGDGIMTGPCECGRPGVATDFVRYGTQRIRPHDMPDLPKLADRRRTRSAARLAAWLEQFDVRSPEAVAGLSPREWAMAGSAVGLPEVPDARLRAAVADAFRVPAGVS